MHKSLRELLSATDMGFLLRSAVYRGDRREDIINAVGVCKIDDNIFRKATGVVESPGMKYKHYAPVNECLLIYFDDINKLAEEVNKNIKEKTVVIGYNELEDKTWFNK